MNVRTIRCWSRENPWKGKLLLLQWIVLLLRRWKFGYFIAFECLHECFITFIKRILSISLFYEQKETNKMNKNLKNWVWWLMPKQKEFRRNKCNWKAGYMNMQFCIIWLEIFTSLFENFEILIFRIILWNIVSINLFIWNKWYFTM